MKTRFKNGKPIANVYEREEHGIDISKIDKDALKIIQKLESYGFESYIVGGAIRDLLLGKVPKDFDIVTSATPRQVHKQFYNSRIIGRRFRIVHVTFGDKIFEVSTFRSNKEHSQNNDNEFGTIEEDASRRDFSINSLYYNPTDEILIDFNNALRDFKRKIITPVIPISTIFTEDPVRMIRAVKFSVTTGFRIPLNLKLAIKRHSPELDRISTSRLTEELNKIINSGYSSQIFRQLRKYRLFVYLLPCISVYSNYDCMYKSLDVLDMKIISNKNKPDSDPKKVKIEEHEPYLALTSPFIVRNNEAVTPNELLKDVYRQIKFLISPNTPPNYLIENTAKAYLNSKGLVSPKNRKRRKVIANKDIKKTKTTV